ncbi:MAG: EpsI family protein, partial [Gemmatimonadetes bacterium]|nr:EpsI family protein [Gemmatimonadota bacterium]
MDKTMFGKYLPALVLLVGFGLILSARSQRAVPLASSLSEVLPAYDGYRVTNQVIADDERRVAGMSDYVARAYWRPDSTMAFSVYVGYYDRQTQGKTIHSPRNCLPGAGWEVLRAETGTVMGEGGSHVVNRYLLKNGVAQSVVFYWYQGRGRIVANEYAVKWNLLRDAALEGHTEEALVRIVIPVRNARGLQNPDFERALADANTLGQTVG